MLRAMIKRLAMTGILVIGGAAHGQIGTAETHVSEGEWTLAAEVYAAAAENSSDPALWYRLGVVQAISGDPEAAAESFARVRDLDSGFPEIDQRIASAVARAEWEASQSADPEGFDDDAAVREEVRRRALDNGDVITNARAASGTEPGASPALDSREHGLLAEPDAAVEDAIHALGDAPSERDHALAAADTLRRAGELGRARYFLRLYIELGGDPAEALPVRRAIENAELPGAE